VAEAVGLVFIVPTIVVTGEPFPGIVAIAIAALAGTIGFVGLLAFYRALAGGTMSLVAPVAAVIGAGLPVVAGVAGGDSLSPTEAAGIVVALVAVSIVSRPAADAGVGRGGLALALIAGAGFGGFFIVIDLAVQAGAQTWWPVVASRSATIVAGSAVALAQGRAALLLRQASPIMIVCGVADTLGNVLFLLANAQGSLGIAAVLASMYPAVTVLLAWQVLGERLARIHAVGVALVFVGIALIAAP